jgi:hypothetical protein
MLDWSPGWDQHSRVNTAYDRRIHTKRMTWSGCTTRSEKGRFKEVEVSLGRSECLLDCDYRIKPVEGRRSPFVVHFNRLKLRDSVWTGTVDGDSLPASGNSPPPPPQIPDVRQASSSGPRPVFPGNAPLHGEVPVSCLPPEHHPRMGWDQSQFSILKQYPTRQWRLAKTVNINVCRVVGTHSCKEGVV